MKFWEILIIVFTIISCLDLLRKFISYKINEEQILYLLMAGGKWDITYKLTNFAEVVMVIIFIAWVIFKIVGGI